MGSELHAGTVGDARARTCARLSLAVLVLIALVGSTWASPAQAQATRLLDRFSIGVGAYRAVSSTTLGVRLPHGLFASSINLEDDLGFDDSNVLPRIRASVLVGDHQGLSLDYYRYSHVASRAWQRGFTLRGTDYHAYAQLHARVAFAFGSLAWRWWFGTGNDVFGLGFGASHYRASGELHGKVGVNGGPDVDEEIAEDTGTSTWAPLLQVGWRHAFGPHWRAYFDGAGVFKGGGKLSGHIFNASIGVEWLPAAHLGLAVEYGVNSIHVRHSGTHYDDSLDLELYGPSAFVYVRF